MHVPHGAEQSTTMRRRTKGGDSPSAWSKMRGLHAFGMLQDSNEKTIDDEVFLILPHKRS